MVSFVVIPLEGNKFKSLEDWKSWRRKSHSNPQLKTRQSFRRRSMTSNIHPSIQPFIHPSNHSTLIHLNIHPSIYLFIRSFIHPSIHPSTHPSKYRSIHISIHSLIHPSTRPSFPPPQPRMSWNGSDTPWVLWIHLGCSVYPAWSQRYANSFHELIFHHHNGLSCVRRWFPGYRRNYHHIYYDKYDHNS